MKDEVVLRALRSLPDAPTSRSCPCDSELSAFFEGALEEPDRDRVSSHLVGCRRCRGLVGFLAEVNREQPEAEGLSAARGGSARRPEGVGWRWAAAAVVTLGLGVTMLRFVGQPVDPETQGSGPLREVSQGLSAPVLLTPTEGAVAAGGEVVFRWSPVQDSTSYVVHVLNADGDLVWRSRVGGTEAILGPEAELSPGEEYFVQVRAELAGSKTLQSPHVRFFTGPLQ